MQKYLQSIFMRILLFFVWVFFSTCLNPFFAVAGELHYTYDTMHRLVRVQYGTATVIDRVYDALGNQLAKTVTSAIPDNSPPEVPSVSAPADAETDVNPAGVLLAWQSGDSNANNIVSYDIFFGENPTPELIKSGVIETQFTTPSLKSLTSACP